MNKPSQPTSIAPALSGLQSLAVTHIGESIVSGVSSTAATADALKNLQISALAATFARAQGSALADAVKAMRSPAITPAMTSITARAPATSATADALKNLQISSLPQAFSRVQGTAVADAVKAMRSPAIADVMAGATRALRGVQTNSTLTDAVASMHTPTMSALIKRVTYEVSGTAMPTLVAEALDSLRSPKLASVLADSFKAWQDRGAASILGQSIKAGSPLSVLLARTMNVIGDLRVDPRGGDLLDLSSDTVPPGGELQDGLAPALVFTIVVAMVWTAANVTPAATDLAGEALACTLFSLRVVDGLVDRSPELSGLLDVFGLIGLLGLLWTLVGRLLSGETD